MLSLKDNIQYLKGVGPKKAVLLETLGIRTLEDALFCLPYRYEDRSNLAPISQLKPGETQTFCGTVLATDTHVTRRKKKVYEVIVGDQSGFISVKWFQKSYLKKFEKDDQVIVSGLIQYNQYLHKKDIYHPEIEKLDHDKKDDFLHIGRIVPVYHTTEGLHQKSLRTIIKNVLDQYVDSLKETLPDYILKKNNFTSLIDSVKFIHSPDDTQSVDALNSFNTPIQKRLVFEELLLLELGLAMKKNSITLKKKGFDYEYKKDLLNSLAASLPFKLTSAQKRVAKEILDDLMKPYPMNRLLQGDVGSGKTIVAVVAALLVLANNYQVAFMSPTEILAQQHYKKVCLLLEKFDVEVVLLTKNAKPKERKSILDLIKDGTAKIVIGTHSLIQNDIHFKNLALAIIDEQHKFGVIQRKSLKSKGRRPDILIMTATPIPRTLAMTVYGDLNISVIDEMPGGRKPIQTYVIYEKKRQDAYNFLRKEIKKGHQAYIVYPLVEESEKLELKSAVSMMEHFTRDVFPDLRLGLIHGRIKADEKEVVMNQFYKGQLDILVTTTVVEVGVDVPNASLMLVEHAERFGLAQLHQLRGRIGRGQCQSYCILLPAFPMSEDAKKRLKVMRESLDGFYIAEKDLEIRGPGEFFGTRQSGIPELRVANIIRDSKLLGSARKMAFEIVEDDPSLSKEKNGLLKESVVQKWQKKLSLIEVG